MRSIGSVPRFIVLPIVATALLVASCAPGDGGARPSASSAALTTESTAALQRFYNQQLTFAPCDKSFTTIAADETAVQADPRFRCARLEVPLDYTKPDGRTAKIALLKVPARGAKIGSLLLNPGGPGGPGIGMAAAGSTSWATSPLTERFDLVGFDPRGVGASTPTIDCFSDAELDAGTATTSTTVGYGSLTETDTRALLARCAERSGGLDALAAMSTRNTVRDMDILRAVLGDEKLSFLGQSYGTRLGAVYAEMFPQKVRALVLDGAIDPTLGTVDRRLIQWAGFQRSFQAMAEFCARSADCPLGTDPTRASEEFQRIARPLIDNPIPNGNRGSFGFNEAYGAMVAGLYFEQLWPVIVRGLTELKNRQITTLAKIGDTFSGRGADGRYGNFSEAVFAINCMDEDRNTPAQESELKRRIQQVAPFTDAGRGFDTRDPCEFWPGKPTLGYPYATDIQGLPTTVVVSITGDPTTTHAGGIALAKTLGSALLTVNGEQHTVALANTNACVNEIVSNYLVNLTPPAAGATCTL